MNLRHGYMTPTNKKARQIVLNLAMVADAYYKKPEITPAEYKQYIEQLETNTKKLKEAVYKKTVHDEIKAINADLANLADGNNVEIDHTDNLEITLTDHIFALDQQIKKLRSILETKNLKTE
jgi:polyhydroxyalkanoate synthesis regulator phasin